MKVYESVSFIEVVALIVAGITCAHGIFKIVLMMTETPSRRRLSLTTFDVTVMVICAVVLLVGIGIAITIKLEQARHYYLQAHILNAHTRSAQERIGRVAHHMVELSESTERLSEITKRRMNELSPAPPVAIGVAQHV